MAPNQHPKTVTHALVTSKLDYGNTLYAEINKKLTRRLLTIQNSAARITLNLPRHSYITSRLKELHCFPIHKRAQFKLLTHTFKALYN